MNRAQLPSQTKIWYDLDHPMPGTRFTLAELEEQATCHERNRLEAVSEMIGIVGLMTARGLLSGQEVVTVGPAKRQHGQGKRDLQVVAAHCLPGQIAFDGQLLHTSNRWSPEMIARCQLKPLPLAAKLRSLDGLTNYVTTIVNQADSLLEAGSGGLKPSFGRAVGSLLHDLVADGTHDWQIIGTKVLRAVNNYRLAAGHACGVRLREFESHRQARSFNSPEVYKARIIRHYLDTINNRSFVPLSASGFLQLVDEIVINQNGDFQASASILE